MQNDVKTHNLQCTNAKMGNVNISRSVIFLHYYETKLGMQALLIFVLEDACHIDYQGTIVGNHVNPFHRDIFNSSALIPPNKTTEFDDHLRRSVMELKDLGEDVKISVIFCYSKLNVPSLEDENKLVHPGHIIEDLRKDGFNV